MTNRKKAQDVFNETNFLFSQKGSFEESFPEIASINVQVIEKGHGVDEWTNPRRFSIGNIGEYINCSNTPCYNGGFSIGSIIRGMVYKKETHSDGDKPCQGYEGSPKGRIRYRSCTNYFHFTIEIKYKEQ